MNLANHKTKLVCTIGPSTDKLEMMVKMIESGMNIARLNYSHGDFKYHQTVIHNLHEAAKIACKRITIMADLPGPKMRIGKLENDNIELHSGDQFILTTDKIIGSCERVYVSFNELPKVVKPDNILYLNDGLIQVKVLNVVDNNVYCEVVVGGELRSYKGLNLPGIDLGICAFTEHDHECLKSALESGVDAISQSFVNGPLDIEAVRTAAKELGYNPFIIAKIERFDALGRIEDIIKVSDGIMIARGDLGVEIQIEQIAIVQKQLTALANLFGKPVITATQMLESMVDNPRPTRAEATDVANAILDGTDCIMLSEESAVGKYPLEAVNMLCKIASSTEPHRNDTYSRKRVSDYYRPDTTHITDIISHDVQHTVEHLNPSIVIASTVTGHTARMISRFKLPVWVTAISSEHQTCQNLQFSYGIYPLHVPHLPYDWKSFICALANKNNIKPGWAVLIEGPSPDNPNTNHRIEIIDIRGY